MAKARYIVILIPARAGSTRIRNKNLQLVDCQSLIRHALDDAYEAARILAADYHRVEVAISTDYRADDLGDIGTATVIARPAHLADSHADIGAAIHHAASTRSRSPDYVVTLQPTVMSRTGQIVADLVRRCIRHRCCGLTLTEAVPWQWTSVYDGIEPLHQTEPYQRSQALGRRWEEFNAVMVTSLHDWVVSRRWSFPLIVASLPSWAAIDIDDERDLRMAQLAAGQIRQLLRLCRDIEYIHTDTGETV